MTEEKCLVNGVQMRRVSRTLGWGVVYLEHVTLKNIRITSQKPHRPCAIMRPFYLDATGRERAHYTISPELWTEISTHFQDLWVQAQRQAQDEIFPNVLKWGEVEKPWQKDWAVSESGQ